MSGDTSLPVSTNARHYIAVEAKRRLHQAVSLKSFPRLRLHYEHTAFMHEAALSLAMCMVCFRHL